MENFYAIGFLIAFFGSGILIGRYLNRKGFTQADFDKILGN